MFLHFGLFFLLAVVSCQTDKTTLLNTIDTIVKTPALKTAADKYEKLWKSRSSGQQFYGAKNFSCPNMKSPVTPNNVNALRPGDFAYIAALGDSLTAGNGAGAQNVIEVAVEYRGLVFAVGGDGNITYQTSTPNLLRTFNVNLFGQSHGVGEADYYPTAHFNVAVPGSKSSDLPSQATMLVQRFKDHTNYDDFIKGWKLINIFIGANDLCDYCTHVDSHTPQWFYNNLHKTIEILRDGLPRTLVSIAMVPHIEFLRKVEQGHWFCAFMHSRECTCIDNYNFTDADFDNISKKYQAQEKLLQFAPEFDREDFAVIVQPFFENTYNILLDADGFPDLTFLAPDCFHLSRKGHDYCAHQYWNNLVMSIELKATEAHWNDLSLKCPDLKCPYIRTVKNSKDCSKFFIPK